MAIRNWPIIKKMMLHTVSPFCLSRNYTGQDLDPLSYKELHYLEQKIDTALKSIRSRKVKFKFACLCCDILVCLDTRVGMLAHGES